MTKLHFLSMLPLLSLAIAAIWGLYRCSDGHEMVHSLSFYWWPEFKSACTKLFRYDSMLPLVYIRSVYILFLICKLRFCVCFCMDIMYIIFYFRLYSTRPRNWLESMAYLFFTISLRLVVQYEWKRDLCFCGIDIKMTCYRYDVSSATDFVYIFESYMKMLGRVLRRTVYVREHDTVRQRLEWCCRCGCWCVRAVYGVRCCWASRALLFHWWNACCHRNVFEREFLLLSNINRIGEVSGIWYSCWMVCTVKIREEFERNCMQLELKWQESVHNICLLGYYSKIKFILDTTMKYGSNFDRKIMQNVQIFEPIFLIFEYLRFTNLPSNQRKTFFLLSVFVVIFRCMLPIFPIICSTILLSTNLCSSICSF